jgi:oligoribonuclease
MKLLWLDLETTGLEPLHDRILEIAIIEAEFDNPFVPLTSLVKTRGYHACVKFDASLYTLNPFIRTMHTKNGLFDDCKNAQLYVEDIDSILGEKYGPCAEEVDNRPILAGSTIHFDHSFIETHMPRFNKILSYRHYDVSAIQLFCRSLGMSKIPKAEAHRAMADIQESMRNAKICAEWLKGIK